MSDQRKKLSEPFGNAKTRVNAAGTQQPAENTIDLVELMYRMVGRWKLIACMALVFAVAAGVYTICFIKPMYQATSTIYVLNRSDSAINMADLQIGTALTSDYIKAFYMWEVHAEVISNLGLSYTYGEMRDMLSVVNAADTRMLDITFTSPSAEEAASVANEYAKVASQYISETMSTDRPNIMSVALIPANPVSPNKTKNIIIGFMLGAILACAIVAVQMLVDDKYKTADDIRRFTGLVTLAVVPIDDESAGKGRRGTINVGRKL